MRMPIPAPVIAACAGVIAERETHASLDRLFMHAGAPGDPPEGSKPVKAQEWLRRINADQTVTPLKVLGLLIEGYMEEEPPEAPPFSDLPAPIETEDQAKIRKALTRYQLQYVLGGSVVSGSLSSPSKALEDFIKDRDVPALDQEFKRALSNVDQSPREAVSAASNILESVCKVCIAERGIEMPAKQDLKPVWTVVRKDLGFDPGAIEDQDLQVILTGLIAVVEGIGALRTHASSAHGAGKKQYKLEPRHARLAIHAAHTVALFVLETWAKRGK
ncbi:abortive infection family protein [Achromobacter insolitus]|uniref:abortive infection family protein n=1 Tax=Achromobacter insolitus TaxID=217204 RepID=UPI00244E8EFA|nr:abortive infection family protein [Achromobacter insolitus]MDH3062309.1 abortive infection family protein [Achromobacter insolitus]